MNVWLSKNWVNYYKHYNCRKGLRLNFEKGIDSNIRKECLKYCNWLRNKYEFPMRIPIYFKNVPYIKAKDGDHVSAIFFGPYERYIEPFISISLGKFADDVNIYGYKNCIIGIFNSITHELTHYFQWINNIELSEKGEELQAVYYTKLIVNEYLNQTTINLA